MQLNLTDASANAFLYALRCYMDNENDKGREGIGEAKLDELYEIYRAVEAGRRQLMLTPIMAGLILEAAEIFTEDADTYSGIPGAEEELTRLIGELRQDRHE